MSEVDGECENDSDGDQEKGSGEAPDSAHVWSFPEDAEAVRDALVSWYEDDHRDFPWRRTDDPYEILVSEVMSQQTQLGRVEEAWHEFLDRWPTVDDLAEADRSDVVGFWTSHSLGYNNRAKYLHEAARQVVEGEVGPTDRPHGTGETGGGDGQFPTTPDGLEALMGVGPYTANAVASFAFNEGNAVVDTNVKRVLHRAFAVPDDDDEFDTAAQKLMPDGESRIWNNAIMELGGVACGKTPRCDEAACPWRAWCHAYETGDFTAPDVPTQPQFEGSRRQMRGRVVGVLSQHGELELDELGPRVRVDYTPDGETSDGENGREWLRGLVEDLADDELVDVEKRNDGIVARLRQ